MPLKPWSVYMDKHNIESGLKFKSEKADWLMSPSEPDEKSYLSISNPEEEKNSWFDKNKFEDMFDSESYQPTEVSNFLKHKTHKQIERKIFRE